MSSVPRLPWSAPVVLTMLAACRHGSATPATTIREAAPDAGPTVVATPAPAPAPDAGSGVLLLDTPAWPAGTRTIRLTWVMYPKVDEPGKGTQRFNVELVVRGGDVVRRFSTTQLGTDRGSTYTFDAAEQAGCNKDTKHRVASLFLGGGGYVSFDVQRAGDDLVLSKEDVCALGGTDGKCDIDQSPARPGVLARIPIPHDATFQERFHIVDDATHEHDERCPVKNP